MTFVEMAQAGNGHELDGVWLEHLPRPGDVVAVGGVAYDVVTVVHRDATREPRRPPLLLVNTSHNEAYGRYLGRQP